MKLFRRSNTSSADSSLAEGKTASVSGGATKPESVSLFSTRAYWLKNVLAGAILAGFLLSPRLWISTRAYPLSPVWQGLPPIPNPLDHMWFYLLLALAVVILVVPRPKYPILALVVLAGLLSLWDQSRWQP